MNGLSQELHLAVIGAPDFCRRINSACRQWLAEDSFQALSVFTATLPEARALIMTEKPHALLVELSSHSASHDIHWLRSLLDQTRSRFGRNMHIILAVAAPERFVAASSFFFESDQSLTPSGLIDDLLISPPIGLLDTFGIDAQLKNCLTHLHEGMANRLAQAFPLPALWEDAWVPVMCDPESRNVWRRWLPRYARYTNENPIIIGPSGSGKTRLAAALHSLSGRSGPFVSITPRDFSSTELVQAELFGAVAGAYTGAVDKWGLVRRAEKGTLFIDELQSIDRDLQGKLITFIENKSYRRVGEAELHQADVRFVFATNRTLQDLVSDGSLRDDFAYRLERLQIVLPPLDLRPLDIAAGLLFCLGKVLRERNVEYAPGLLQGLSQEAYRLFYCAPWPGNLRQLENSSARLVELADIRGLKLIDANCAGEAIRSLLGKTAVTAGGVFQRAAERVAGAAHGGKISNKTELFELLDEEVRSQALKDTSGSVVDAAALIGDSENALRLFLAARSCNEPD